MQEKKHQNNQIKNSMTTTCGYLCLYFLNEMNKGNSYYDLLKVFHIHDTMDNQKVIEQYFKNMEYTRFQKRCNFKVYMIYIYMPFVFSSERC